MGLKDDTHCPINHNWQLLVTNVTNSGLMLESKNKQVFVVSGVFHRMFVAKLLIILAISSLVIFHFMLAFSMEFIVVILFLYAQLYACFNSELYSSHIQKVNVKSIQDMISIESFFIENE